MSVMQGSSEPTDDSELDVFEIVLPITVLVLSDDDFLPDDSEEQAASVPKSKEEDELEVNLKSSILLQSNGTPLNDSNSVSIWEENKTASDKDNSMTYTEENQVAESVCNESKLYLTDGGGAGMGECQNYVLPTSSCKTQLTERNEASCREECDGDDSCQKISPLFSAGIEGRYDTIKTNSQVTLAVIPKHEEEPVSVANGSSQEIQPEIHKEIETIVEMKDPDFSENADNEASNSKRKRSKFEDETLGSLLERDLKEEPKFTCNCSAPFLNGCFSTSEELLQKVGKLEMSASTSAESNIPGEHIYKTLSPFPKKRRRQQKVISPHASPKEPQNQQEGLACLSNITTIKPLPKASSTKEHEGLNLKCRFCSSVYKCSAHLKKHLYSAHKGKKIYKCCFCKRTFFFSVNLKNHLRLHKKITRLKNARKNRKNVRKVGQRSEERQSETKKKESKYDKLFSKIERDVTPLSVPVSFSCRICFFASSNPRVFIHHMKGHKERPPYQCPQCDYSCISLSYLLNHIYWHAGYKLYQCRFCTFFSLYFASMVRHSYIHTGARRYSCEFCQSDFTSTIALKRHRRLHAGKETCQGQQVVLATRRKRTQRPVKNYTCDECNMVFYTKGRLSFHKKFHELFKANGYMNQSNEYHKRKICKAGSDFQESVSLSLSGGEENDCLSGGVPASAIGSEREDGVQDNKKMHFRKFSENSHGSSSIPTGNRSEVPLNSHHMEAVICKEEPLFSSRASHSQVQDDDACRKYVENLKVTWPSSLSTFETYRCQHCSYATTVHSNFTLHLKLHTNEGHFVCEQCNEAFKTLNDLQKHSLIHVKNGNEFGRCFYVDSCSEDLEWHHEMRVGMCPERDFGSLEVSNCDHSLLGSEVCGLQPDVQGGKVNDLLAQSQPQYYQCPECEYATYISSNLKLHVRTHTGERPYSCSVCQKKFRTSSHLKRHRVTHYNSDYFKCRNCDYSTNKWLSLKQHLASHSCEESSSTGFLYEQKQLPVKTYNCEECGYWTVHNGNLKLHMRIHTGERPYKCSQCAVAFRTSSHLKRHLVTHLKLHCRRCNFSTIGKRALQRHVKTHKRKHKCGKCNEMLPTKRLLEQHKRQHELGI